MPKYGSVEQGYLKRLIESKPKMSNGLVDMTGFDWSSANKVRPHYYEGHIVKVDFSNSNAERGFCVENAVFEECIFNKSIWWISYFIKCRFIKCSFDDCRLYTGGLEGEYYECTFRNLFARGENFTFGRGSIYKKCNFEAVLIYNILDEIGVIFEDCKISGTFTNGTIHGRKYALAQRFVSVRSVFSKGCFPVKFIRCDLSLLKTKNVIFEKDVIFKDCLMGDKSFLNPDKNLDSHQAKGQ